MKNYTFFVDLKSFLLGVLTLGGILLLVNFTPAGKSQPEPALIDTRRFQVVTGERETFILDTQTGRFVMTGNYIGQPRWNRGDFEELHSREKK